MPDPIPSCFRGTVAGGPPVSTAAGPSLTTSIYDTRLGPASLSWSRTALGLSLRADLRLSPSSSSDDDGDEEDDEEELFCFRIRPWLFWKRKGTRRFHHQGGLRRRSIDVAWDLTRARFPPAGGPEPCSCFYAAVAVDGEMLLVAGDMEEEAHRKMKARRRAPATQISRREQVLLKGDPDSCGRRSYRTSARVSGKDREIRIDVGGKEKDASGMCVTVDGTRVLQVRRLRWKFRGSERVEIDCDGESIGRVQISWDLHSWLFPSKEEIGGSGEICQAVFVFRFERNQKEQGISPQTDSRSLCKDLIGGYLGKNRNWSDRSISGKKLKKKKSFLKTASSSSSSASSASSAGSSSVMDWASPEEAELRVFDGFTLVVYAWKT